jgi:hypothetical protein
MAGLRIGTYIDTLELENEALREKVKALEHKIKLLITELNEKDDKIFELMDKQVESVNPSPVY